MRGTWLLAAPAIIGACLAVTRLGAADPALEEALDASAPPVTAPSLEEWWTYPGDCAEAPQASLSVVTASTTLAGAPLTFECQMRAKRATDVVRVQMSIRDEKDVEIGRDEIRMPLSQGPNRCLFHWDAALASPGAYTAEFELQSPGDDPPATCSVHLKRISEATLRPEMDRTAARFAELRTGLDQAAQNGKLVAPLTVRLAVAEEFLARARADADAGRWHAASHKLDYVFRSEKAIYGGFVLGDFPERLVPPEAPDLMAVEARDGGFFSAGQPVFLFGLTVRSDGAHAVQTLGRYGLNLGVADASMAALPNGAAELQPLMDAAREANATLFVQLTGHVPGDTAETASSAFMECVQGAGYDQFLQHADALVSALAAQPAVGGISLAFEPRFKFEDEATRLKFIDHVRTLYEDRHALNQSWRSHMGDLNEIQLIQDPAIHDYHEKRAYQWDWQQFHRMLALDFFRSLQSRIEPLSGGKPLLVTLPDTVFDKGESRDGIDREGLANLMDVSGCTAALVPRSDLYAYSYPQQSAFCTLMRSMQPDKPVLCLENRIAVDEDMPPEAAYGYVLSAVWDAVISGLNGMALPADSPVLERPETLEAFATAAQDINRLAPVVYAMQRAPAEVGVLWSDSSKVLDDGDPYLNSARFAYEGLSFSGYQVRYVTEAQCAAGTLEKLKVFVIPETPAVREETFAAIQKYVENGGTLARVGKPIPYNERGQSRHDVIRNTGKTVLVRGMNLPTEYLHAMDAAIELGSLEAIPRPINASGYPLEGVKTRYIQSDGRDYLFVLNLRREPVVCHLAGPQQTGKDLIRGREVQFPEQLPPLDPMLIRLDSAVPESTLATR